MKLRIGTNPAYQDEAQTKNEYIDIKIPDEGGEGVSRWHATVTLLENDLFFIEDNKSKNGTYVEGCKIEKATIGSNQKVQLAGRKIDLNEMIKTRPGGMKGNDDRNDRFPESHKLLRDDVKALQVVYRMYEKQQKDIKYLKNIDTVISAFISIVVLGVFSIIMGPSAIGVMVLSGVIAKLLLPYITKSEEKIKKINDEKQYLWYKCPECKQDLAFTSWERLAETAKCPKKGCDYLKK